MNNYIPLAVLEALAEQRRPDPKYLAAAGWPLPRPKRQPRRAIGNLLVRIGQRLQGAGHIPLRAAAPAQAA